MARQSRKTAAKYSSLGKAKRKKPKNEITTIPKAKAAPISETESEGVERSIAEPKPAPRPISMAQTKAIQNLPGYDYVRGDLRRIGILAGSVVVILIILTFVLG